MAQSIDEVIEHAEVLVIGNSDPQFAEVVKNLSDDTSVVDLVRIVDPSEGSKTYQGICW